MHILINTHQTPPHTYLLPHGHGPFELVDSEMRRLDALHTVRRGHCDHHGSLAYGARPGFVVDSDVLHVPSCSDLYLCICRHGLGLIGLLYKEDAEVIDKISKIIYLVFIPIKSPMVHANIVSSGRCNKHAFVPCSRCSSSQTQPCPHTPHTPKTPLSCLIMYSS